MKRAPVISPRKTPKQQRSGRLVSDILEAAIRVLEREGAARFTMARVAEKAGVSVGSLYQYFPNKEAILFQLQAGEWDQTRAMLGNILAEPGSPPEVRLRKAVTFFFRSEHAEARFRVALEDAAPLYRDARPSQEGQPVDDRLPGRGPAQGFREAARLRRRYCRHHHVGGGKTHFRTEPAQKRD
jgi:AcrR family transcriptional regulator